MSCVGGEKVAGSPHDLSIPDAAFVAICGFVQQVVRVVYAAGLVDLGTWSIDGPKVRESARR